MKHIALQLEFETDKFRLTGPIPEDSNAGNQFYGEDFAKWICDSLPNWHLDYLDEDWGWYVFSVRQETPKDETNEICVYAYPEEGGRQLNDDGAWMLIVHPGSKFPRCSFSSVGGAVRLIAA